MTCTESHLFFFFGFISLLFFLFVLFLLCACVCGWKLKRRLLTVAIMQHGSIKYSHSIEKMYKKRNHLNTKIENKQNENPQSLFDTHFISIFRIFVLFFCRFISLCFFFPILNLVTDVIADIYFEFQWDRNATKLMKCVYIFI